MVRRETCRRCEEAGVITPLIPYQHWGICPVHEPGFAMAIQPVQAQYVRDPVLAERGKPTRGGVRS